MQTFVPYSTYTDSAGILDNRRLNKQILEGIQILEIVTQESIITKNVSKNTGWVNHPAVNMWRDCPNGLMNYIESCINEWISRGFEPKNMINAYYNFTNGYFLEYVSYPEWWNGNIHVSHAKALLFKSVVKMVTYALSHNYQITIRDVYYKYPNKLYENLERFNVVGSVAKEIKKYNQNTIVSALSAQKEAQIYLTYNNKFEKLIPELDYYWPI